ncbi:MULTISPECIES: DUF7661 family protein [Burkholderia]|uniref:DUF7661 domain-containing protein n=1 Tax=Burkholderia cepacia TaxID=292 RepID=A0ABN5D812_BURCE|nr:MULTISPECIES: hypothetical protein [Burkholderia]AIO29132.1 hypothetical protein DM41_6287 [Burkholderia cepacia ATCC 25416]ALK21994.1 hypothetical protein APZ15_30260 [Burkholderia cepacia ATCC 25416]ASE97937.1 hypothetical protein CEQ23_31520 [Burkholderia cepacia]ATF81097.1 hypothetical protein CO711_27345 [Burkholderia cepacia]EMD9442609.1 hypothetical protein [Burkholderia cepacia]
MQDEYRFNAFGRLLAVVRKDDRWAVFDLGTEGKRRAANLHIPSALAADELAQYLGDLLHESATPRYNEVVPVPLRRA